MSPLPMPNEELARVERRVHEVFPHGTPESSVCEYVLHCLVALGDQFESVRLGDVTDQLNIPEENKFSAITRALDWLAIGDTHILERAFEIWIEDGRGDEIPHRLTASEVIQVLEGEEYVNPYSRQSVEDFESRVSIIYEVTSFAHSLVGARN